MAIQWSKSGLKTVQSGLKIKFMKSKSEVLTLSLGLLSYPRNSYRSKSGYSQGSRRRTEKTGENEGRRSRQV